MRTDGRIDMKKVIVAFRNFEKAPLVIMIMMMMIIE